MRGCRPVERVSAPRYEARHPFVPRFPRTLALQYPLRLHCVFNYAQGTATAFYTVLSQSKAGYLAGTGILLFCLGGNFAMFPALCSKARYLTGRGQLKCYGGIYRSVKGTAVNWCILPDLSRTGVMSRTNQHVRKERTLPVQQYILYLRYIPYRATYAWRWFLLFQREAQHPSSEFSTPSQGSEIRSR